MRILTFAKIDYIKTKQQMYIFPVGLVLIIAVMLFSDTGGFNTITPFIYELFFAIVFSTAPFGACRREDAGFLMLLPATTRDRVVGRFLYGLSLMLFAAACGGIFMIIYVALGYRYSTTELAICLIGLVVSILIVTLEYVFLYLFGENQGPQILNFVRVIPGMCYFFVGLNLSNQLVAHPEEAADVIEFVISHLGTISIVGIAAALIVLAAAIELCVRVTEKKDC